MVETKLKKTEVESFVEKILADTKKKADEMVEEAKKAAEEALKRREEEAREKARQDIQKLVDSAKADAERTRLSILSEARLKASWVVPSTKDALIQEVFDSVKAKMEVFTGKLEYKTFIEKLIKEGTQALGGGGVVIVLNERDSKLKLDLNKISENVTRELGTDTTIKLSPENVRCIGGVIVKTSDGKIAVDNTVEGLIERISREYRLRVARELFAS